MSMVVEDTYGLQAHTGSGGWVHIFRVGTKVISNYQGYLSEAQYEAYTQAEEWVRESDARLGEATALLERFGFDVIVL